MPCWYDNATELSETSTTTMSTATYQRLPTVYGAEDVVVEEMYRSEARCSAVRKGSIVLTLTLPDASTSHMPRKVIPCTLSVCHGPEGSAGGSDIYFRPAPTVWVDLRVSRVVFRTVVHPLNALKEGPRCHILLQLPLTPAAVQYFCLLLDTRTICKS